MFQATTGGTFMGKVYQMNGGGRFNFRGEFIVSLCIIAVTDPSDGREFRHLKDFPIKVPLS